MTKADKTKNGILYVILIELEGKPLVKIGVTHRSIEDRVVEILTSIFKKYREFPYCRPKRFRNTSDIYDKEKTLHKMFESSRYTTAKKFSGHTEFFDVPLEDVVTAYEKLLSGKDKPVAKT
tara:strand:+ start:1066 stop:1428 length:363 start_codon:yes stop_codon:yes gene_type:complete